MSRRYLRPGVLVGHVLVLAAALICLRLGWWQWDVFEFANRGTVQNLGYALLWPVFAGAFVYMWLRFLYLESAREADAGGAQDGHGAGSLAGGGSGGGGSAIEDASVAQGAGVGGDGEPGNGSAGDGSASDGNAGDGNAGDAVTEDTAARGGDDGEPEGGVGPAGAQAVRSVGAPDGSVTAEGPDENDAAPSAVDGDPGQGGRGRRGRGGHHPPNESRVIAVATVGDDDDDAELAAYNRALAELAEQDRRRAR
jgi:hypothetical protein